jgi:hypothetical protein
MATGPESGDGATEVPLEGDGVTPGVVRIGDTVRRPVRPFTGTVQRYLAALQQAGFHDAPVPLGVDDQGREVLSYVAGDVPKEPLPPACSGEDVLVAMARLVRRLHEAAAGWVPPADAWSPAADAALVTAQPRPADRGVWIGSLAAIPFPAVGPTSDAARRPRPTSPAARRPPPPPSQVMSATGAANCEL